MDLQPSTEAEYLAIVFHDDENTPSRFVKDLLQAVLNMPAVDAARVLSAIEIHGQGICGPFVRPVAEAFMQALGERIDGAGHPLLVTLEECDELGKGLCRLCRDLAGENRFNISGRSWLICDDCAREAASQVREALPDKEFETVRDAMAWHFAGTPLRKLVTATRRFPGHVRADLQRAVDQVFPAASLRFFGIQERSRYDDVTIAALTGFASSEYAIAPPRYEEVDIGEDRPVQCLNNGLWLCREGDLRYAALIAVDRNYHGESDVAVEIMVPVGSAGADLTERCFAEIERIVNEAGSYRGKILSFETAQDYRGRSRGLFVHRLESVSRDALILPADTLQALDRNVIDFVRGRAQLRALGQSTRKGILLYGPPGTGKTHTIRYLASNLPGHTTLIITAAQVGLLGAYMNLARLLQPVLVVIEDVDLIARDRDEMEPCEEVLLNQLLNEMDGLREDADILFILTTNRPEDLEVALASRPGRIDQAIEIPLPDDAGRRRLAHLYSGSMQLGDDVARELARRTEGVSGAFIKELMRRIAQVRISRSSSGPIDLADLDLAVEDMTLGSGVLNLRLLCAEAEEA